MVPVGDGVWISLKYDSTLRLFHGTTLTCMQDLNIGPSVQRLLGIYVYRESRACTYYIQDCIVVTLERALAHAHTHTHTHTCSIW